MRGLRLLFRIFGWLLTPFLAWAASFFGAVGGSLVAARIADPLDGVLVTAAAGGLTGVLTIVLWLRFLRRSPEIREVLAVREDGTPDTTGAGVSTDEREPPPRPAPGRPPAPLGPGSEGVRP